MFSCLMYKPPKHKLKADAPWFSEDIYSSECMLSGHLSTAEQFEEVVNILQ